ncbi:uncharacterized protein [Rutidosis leptorrhynchoides]|uniref:uncharacterized protein n=1 Tax=Rutidosis leptorrhynchoides TaxID=125765 RepID=UPI003A991F42
MSQHPENNELGSGNLYNFGLPNTPGSSSNSPQNVRGKEVAKEPQHKKLWTPSEEIWLASCWIDCSEDGVHGNSQRGPAFWTRIHNKFNDNDQGFLRNNDQLSGKWHHLDKVCKDFTALYNEEERNPRRSGRNEDDVYNLTVQEWQERASKPWGYKDVWEFLKRKPKWYSPPAIGGTGVRRRRGSQLQLEDEDDDVVGENQTVNLEEDRLTNLHELFGPDEIQRPMGRERSKNAAKKIWFI